MSKYLFIGSHCDDIELSCGGMITKLLENNEIDSLALSDCGNPELGKEYEAAMTLLGVHNIKLGGFPVRQFHKHRQDILSLLREHRDYDYVVTHSASCIHQDHKTVARECLRAFKWMNLITYLQPWNGNENPNYFVELTGDQLEKKINALYCYRSQSHRPYMSSDFIRAQAVYNGVKCGKKYAESFKIERLIQ